MKFTLHPEMYAELLRMAREVQRVADSVRRLRIDSTGTTLAGMLRRLGDQSFALEAFLEQYGPVAPEPNLSQPTVAGVQLIVQRGSTLVCQGCSASADVGQTLTHSVGCMVEGHLRHAPP